jgi:hypothetical protein
MYRIQKLFFYILLLITTPIFSQTPDTLTNVLVNDIKLFFPKDEIIGDILGLKTSPRQIELLEKFQIGVQKNYEWFIESIKNRKEGETMPYHPNLGLTENEYKELNSYNDNVEFTKIESGKIKIINQNNTISFKTEEKLKFLESIKIDIKTNTVFLDNYKLEFNDYSNVTDPKNALKSKWKGYNWVFFEPKGFDIDDFKDLNTLTVKQYKFTLGKLDNNGKTIMIIKGKEIKNGEKLVDFEIPISF